MTRRRLDGPDGGVWASSFEELSSKQIGPQSLKACAEVRDDLLWLIEQVTGVHHMAPEVVCGTAEYGSNTIRRSNLRDLLPVRRRSAATDKSLVDRLHSIP
jgi:hypothetical protein